MQTLDYEGPPKGRKRGALLRKISVILHWTAWGLFVLSVALVATRLLIPRDPHGMPLPTDRLRGCIADLGQICCAIGVPVGVVEASMGTSWGLLPAALCAVCFCMFTDLSIA